jgi:hypothetical protein
MVALGPCGEALGFFGWEAANLLSHESEDFVGRPEKTLDPVLFAQKTWEKCYKVSKLVMVYPVRTRARAKSLS